LFLETREEKTVIKIGVVRVQYDACSSPAPGVFYILFILWDKYTQKKASNEKRCRVVWWDKSPVNTGEG